MRQRKAYIITGCSGLLAGRLLVYVPSRQSLPFAVIGTMAYCSRTNLDDRRRQYQPQIIAIYITSLQYATVNFSECHSCKNLFVEILPHSTQPRPTELETVRSLGGTIHIQ